MSSDRLRDAARAALDTHDALRAIHAQEPPSDENGVPLDPPAWLAYYETSKAAYDRWSEAMDELAFALGEQDMSRHPFNFRPRCEAILAGEEVAAQRER